MRPEDCCARDTKKRAGTVTAVAAHKDWWHADFVLDGPYAARAAELIERSGRVSPGFNPIDKDPHFAVPTSPAHDPTNWYTAARLDEISILTPGSTGWYAGAEVTHEYKPPAPTKAPARQELTVREAARRYVGGDLIIDRSDGTQEIHHGGGRNVRRYYNTPITIR